MKNVVWEKMVDMKDRAYEKVFAKRIEAEKKARLWRTLFIVTVSILGVIVACAVTYTVLKTKFDNDIIARLKARFSREDDDLDFVEASNDDVSVDVVD